MTQPILRTAAEIQRFLAAGISRITGIPAEEVDVTAPIAETGVDSVHALELIGATEEWLGTELPDTLPWTHPSVEQIANHLAGDPALSAPPLAGIAGEPASAPGIAGEAALRTGTTDEPVPRPATAGEPVPRPATAGEPVPRSPADAGEPVAIVGLACRFPGAADKEQFWRLIRDGVDAITEIPPDRWDADAFYDPMPGAPGKMTTRFGGFIDAVDQFDAGLFGIPPAEAAGMDPQQRLFLETTWEALEDAAVPFDALAGSDTGVFVGIYACDYAMRLQRPELIDAHYGMGNSPSLIANRVSHVLDLRGPSVAIATVCSSSLVAIHLACESLRRGESKLAVAGGVNLILEPHTNIWFSQVGALAADGRCKSFSGKADGLVRSEGVGAVVLKTLAAAQADGDEVYAVVRGSAVRHSGRSNGIAAPNGRAQVDVMRAALACAGVDPGDVGYIEAHGTGTPLGDLIEIEALRIVLGDRGCLLGTVKSNIGHTESAAGVAGVIKTALALRHGEIPPHLHADPPVPELAAAGLRIPTVAQPWPAADRPRIAGVSAFGMGGANAHVVLEQAPPRPAGLTTGEVEPAGLTTGEDEPAGLTTGEDEPASLTTGEDEPGSTTGWSEPAGSSPMRRKAHVLTVSAASEPALRALARRYEARIGELDAGRLADACHTVNTGRALLAHRAAVVGTGPDEIHAGLRAVADGRAASNVLTGSVRGGTRPKVGFLLPDRLPNREQDHAAGRLFELYGDEPGFDGPRAAAALAGLLRSWGVEESLAGGDAATLAAQGCQFVVEFGGEPSLAPIVAGYTAGRIRLDLDWPTTLLALGTLYVHGALLRWDAIDGRPAAQRVHMPSYPFERSRHWIDRLDADGDPQ